MGVVIGETAEVGDDCYFYHQVTLGVARTEQRQAAPDRRQQRHHRRRRQGARPHHGRRQCPGRLQRRRGRQRCPTTPPWSASRPARSIASCHAGPQGAGLRSLRHPVRRQPRSAAARPRQMHCELAELEARVARGWPRSRCASGRQRRSRHATLHPRPLCGDGDGGSRLPPDLAANAARSAWPRSRQPETQPGLSGAVVRQAAPRRAGRLGARPGRRLSPGAASDAIAIADIIAAVDEPIHATCATAAAAASRPAEGPVRCQTHDLWDELGRQIQLFLQAVTLADVVAGRAAAPPVAAHRAGGGLAHASISTPTPPNRCGPRRAPRCWRRWTVTGNPSSVHAAGRAARRMLEDAREALAPVRRARRRPGVHLGRHRGRRAGDPRARRRAAA